MVSEDDGTSSSDRRAIECPKPGNVPIINGSFNVSAPPLLCGRRSGRNRFHCQRTKTVGLRPTVLVRCLMAGMAGRRSRRNGCFAAASIGLHFVRLPGRHSGLGRARHFPNISLVGQSHALDNAAGPAVQAQDNVARLEVLGDQRPVIRERDSGGDQSARDDDCDCPPIYVSPSQSQTADEPRPPDHDPGQQVIPADFRIRDWPCRIHSASDSSGLRKGWRSCARSL